MNRVTYDCPLPTPAETARHRALAETIMGWVPRSAAVGDTTWNDDRTVVWAYPQAGVLKGAAFVWPECPNPERGVLYDRSYQAWNPSVDPAAAAELRQRLRQLGWCCTLSETPVGDGGEPWHCRLSTGTGASVTGMGATPEAALTLAAARIRVR